MGSPFYVPGPQRASKVNDLFASIAARYDLINDLQSFGLHRYWKRVLCRLACVRPGDRVLDLCCGTGDVARRFRSYGAKIAGLDFSSPMLSAAQRRSLNSIFLIRGDAMKIPFQDSQFDVVTISYGLRNLADFDGGLREMKRVLKLGGRLLVLDFGKPEPALWRSICFAYLKWCVPWFGRLFCGDPSTYAYILESLRHYPAQQAIAAKMTELGLKHVRVINLLGGFMSIQICEKGSVR